MITITGNYKTKENPEEKIAYEIELDVNSYSDIDVDNMPIEESDRLISEAIQKKYGVTPSYIFVD